VLLLLVGLGTGAWSFFQTGHASTSPVSQYRTLHLKKGTFQWNIAATGVVEPKYTTEIRSKASGAIQVVKVEVGEAVKKGQLLVQLDPTQERRRVNQSKAELTIAQANYLKAQRVYQHAQANYKTALRLSKKGIESRENLNNRKHEVAIRKAERSVAYAQIRRAKEQLKDALDRRKDTEIRAPETGVILQRLVQPGQVITSGASAASGGTILFKMADINQLYIRADVDESDVVRLKNGMKANVTIDALPGKSFTGHIVRINPEGKSQNNVTVFEVIVKMEPRAASVMKLNMTTNLKFEVLRKDNVIVLPAMAVHKRRGKAGVYVLQGDKVRFKRVTTGLSNGVQTVVTKGLDNGDTILPSPPRSKGKRKRRGRRNGNMRNMRRMMRRR
jgi:RND family efflux transporter MFP subunit